MKRFTFLTLIFAATATFTQAQVSGDATISANDPSFGEIRLSTASQYAGAVSSIVWNGKEFINNWDHGRQLQLNATYFNRYECYNPYEAGNKKDGQSPVTSSKLLALTAAGNTLESTTQMAWYVSPEEQDNKDLLAHCGDPAMWLPSPTYTTTLSDYQVHKKITIGFAGLPNVISYLTDLYVPEQTRRGQNEITAVLPYDFASTWNYDVVSREYRPLRFASGEDEYVKVAVTTDGNYAMGFYAPELLQPYGNGSGTGNRWGVVPPDAAYPEPNYACNAIGSIDRYDGFGPGSISDRAYLVIGSMDQVKQSLDQLHYYFRALDPDVFNWREYVALNHLSISTQSEAENHWLTQGIAQGLRASRTFSAADYLQLNPGIGVTTYQGAIDHYLGGGRAEGRGTRLTIGAGMQHLVALTNRDATASGQNLFGQTGSGVTSPSSLPSHVGLAGNLTQIASGDYTSFAVNSDGSLWMWGSNQYGARGDGSSGDNMATPVQVSIPAPVTPVTRMGHHSVAAGSASYSAVDVQGYVWTWGANWNGRLADGTTNARYTPGRVKKSANPNDYLTGVVSVTAGGGTMAALDADGTVWTWGAGADGALGNGSNQDSYYPVQVATINESNATAVPLTGVTQVACGSSGFCIALTRLGKVYGWGSNAFSQLGTSPGGSLPLAMVIPVGQSQYAVDAIAAGASHCVAHSVDGLVYGWGYNGRGQLGTGSASTFQFPPAPMSFGPDGMNEITDVAAGGDFSLMVRYSDRAVFAAGDNQAGQFGTQATSAASYVPIKISLAVSP